MNPEKLYNRIAIFEGSRLKPYQIKGIWHIGYGRNLQANPLDEKERETLRIPARQDSVQWLNAHPISETDAYILMKRDVAIIIDELYPIVAYRKLSANRQMALVDMAYQMGINGLNEFKNMWKFIAENKFNDAAREIKWTNGNIMFPTKYWKQSTSRANSNYDLMMKG